tara:strand:+ start:318 stop:1070 length:753 start_codon:yes stop_codon:yes gene_type:complete
MLQVVNAHSSHHITEVASHLRITRIFCTELITTSRCTRLSETCSFTAHLRCICYVLLSLLTDSNIRLIRAPKSLLPFKRTAAIVRARIHHTRRSPTCESTYFTRVIVFKHSETTEVTPFLIRLLKFSRSLSSPVQATLFTKVSTGLPSARSESSTNSATKCRALSTTRNGALDQPTETTVLAGQRTRCTSEHAKSTERTLPTSDADSASSPTAATTGNQNWRTGDGVLDTYRFANSDLVHHHSPRKKPSK